MDENKYIGQSLQIRGVEEHVIASGKGKGMKLFEVRNGKGLSLTFSCDRAMDITRAEFMGMNMGYFSPCGYVAPAFYDGKGNGFLKSFTAGFLTTCGLTAVGTPCVDEGEELPLHGTLSNIPCENSYYEETEDEILIYATIRDGEIFGRQLLLKRCFKISKKENSVIILDTTCNIGSKSPLVCCFII